MPFYSDRSCRMSLQLPVIVLLFYHRQGLEEEYHAKECDRLMH